MYLPNTQEYSEVQQQAGARSCKPARESTTTSKVNNDVGTVWCVGITTPRSAEKKHGHVAEKKNVHACTWYQFQDRHFPRRNENEVKAAQQRRHESAASTACLADVLDRVRHLLVLPQVLRQRLPCLLQDCRGADVDLCHHHRNGDLRQPQGCGDWAAARHAQKQGTMTARTKG